MAVERWAKRIFILSVLVTAVVLGIMTVRRAAFSPYHNCDFTVYTAAGRAVLEGTDIYQAHNVRGWYYMYLPVFAAAMTGFALLPIGWAALVWYLLSIGMLAQTLHLSAVLARRFPETSLSVFWLRGLVLLLVLLPALSGIALGQSSVLIAYLVAAGVYLHFRGRDWLSGLCLAGAIVIKVFPALLLVYLLARGRLRAAAATLLWLVVLLWAIPGAVFGVARNQALLEEWAETIALPAGLPESAQGNVRYGQMIDPATARNQSLQAVLFRWFAAPANGSAAPGTTWLSQGLALAIGGLFLAATALALWKCGSRVGPERALVETSAVVLLMLFLCPVAWHHNYTVALLPLSVALAVWGSPHLREARPALAAALLGFAVASFLEEPFPWLEERGVLFWGGVVLWAALIRVLFSPSLSGGERAAAMARSFAGRS
jgi:hypothetical protein